MSFLIFSLILLGGQDIISFFYSSAVILPFFRYLCIFAVVKQHFFGHFVELRILHLLYEHLISSFFTHAYQVFIDRICLWRHVSCSLNTLIGHVIAQPHVAVWSR